MLAWLECEKVSDGMFEDELGIKSQNSEGKVFTLFTDRRTTKEENGKLYVRVTLLSKGEKESFVVLPSDPYELGSRIVKVNTSKIKED